MKKLFFLFAAIFLTFCTEENTTNAQLQIVQAFPNLSFDQPTDIQSPKDGSGRLFVLAQPGQVHVFQNKKNVASSEIFLDIEDQVLSGGEQGLLGLAFHPDFSENGYFYLDYTTDNPRRSVISRWSVSSDNPNRADPGSETVLLEVEQPYSNHNGGQIQFGPDGYLYISLGDGGAGGDPHNNGQDPTTLLGTILRIDVDNPSGENNYGIPQDNPFAGSNQGADEVFAYGLRNVWRFSFDEQGRIWGADVGQNEWEEVNIIEKGGNYGWNIMEGTHCYEPPQDCDQTGLIMPIVEYGHNQSGGYSITGGYVYRGSDASELTGRYIYADFVSGNIWAIDQNGENNERIFESGYPVSTFGEDETGELYFASYDGKIFKFSGTPSGTGYADPPAEYRLKQNYPNPFNPETNIEFSLAESGSALLQVFDVLGRKVTTLFDGWASAGEHNVTWSAADFASGVYIYRLKSGEYAQTKAMMLMK